MRKNQISWIAAVLFFNFVSVCLAQTGSPNTTGLSFLKLGVGGRASAMGEAYIAVADEVTATFWNPAGLSYLTQAQLGFTRTEWIQGVSNEFLAFAFPLLSGTFGLSIHSNHVGGIERRINPSDEPLGTVDANDLALGISYGRALNSAISAGVTVKYLYEKIFIDSASGFALDFGLLIKPFTAPLKIALVVQNLGSMNNLRDQSIDLPATLRIGGAYLFGIEAIAGGVLLAADGVKVFGTDIAGGSDFRGNFGLELQVKNSVALRFGYQTGFEDKSVTGGFGFYFQRYQLNYGYAPFSSNLGDTHRISFALNL